VSQAAPSSEPDAGDLEGDEAVQYGPDLSGQRVGRDLVEATGGEAAADAQRHVIGPEASLGGGHYLRGKDTAAHGG
jgi:hypothetical protein